MLLITVTSVVALALTYFMKKSYRVDPAQLAEPHTKLLTTAVQIICGNCSGDELRPVKTYLNRSGHCALCGGSSYILASDRAIYGRALIATRLASRDMLMAGGQVLRFKLPQTSDEQVTLGNAAGISPLRQAGLR